MRNLPIAYGNSCQAKLWSNKTITWDALSALQIRWKSIRR